MGRFGYSENVSYCYEKISHPHCLVKKLVMQHTFQATIFTYHTSYVDIFFLLLRHFHFMWVVLTTKPLHLSSAKRFTLRKVAYYFEYLLPDSISGKVKLSMVHN
jgi:hypothetical protein